jgi:biotin carboxyl carrier protein
MKISAKAGSQVLEVTVERENGFFVVEVDGERHVVDAHKLEGDFYSILTEGRSYEISVESRSDAYLVRHGAAEKMVQFTDPSRRAREGMTAAEGPEKIRTMMPGKVVRLLVAEGDQVEAEQGVVVVEAMKMENEIVSTKAGRIVSIAVQPGDVVEGGATLLVVE